jgi:hypothetical protein
MSIFPKGLLLRKENGVNNVMSSEVAVGAIY